MEVKILSGWSNPGGSTTAFINLTNLLNSNGVPCIFYGAHDWHLDKCSARNITKYKPHKYDILISHFIRVNPICKKHIYSCHEKSITPLKKMDLSWYDLVVFVSNSQKDWQDITHPSAIIPPIVNKVTWHNPKNNIAGVIGSIDRNKQTHESIKRALNDGYNKVILFGGITDTSYFNESVRPFVESGDAVWNDNKPASPYAEGLAGYEDDREAMYGQISEVYHSSLSETYGLVEAECRLSGVPFNGDSNGQDILDNKDILKRWKDVLKINQ